MDIEKLKLTYPEMLAASNVPERSYIRVDGRQIADAQLAKLGWGMVDWINLQLDIVYGAESATNLLLTMRNELTDALEAAALPPDSIGASGNRGRP